MPNLESFVQASQEAVSVAQVQTLLQDFLAFYSFDVVGFCRLTRGWQAPPGEAVLFHNFPQEWADYYWAENKGAVDPRWDVARVWRQPFSWYEADQYVSVAPAGQDFLGEMRAAGFRDGWSVPVYAPPHVPGYFGMASLTGPVPLSTLDLRRIQLACQQVYFRCQELAPLPAASVTRLAQREREVLHWIAQGKSNGDIAGILGLSPHTVDTLTRRCFAKLDVADRVSAAVRGVAQGLIVV